jgi:hypothetical protein
VKTGTIADFKNKYDEDLEPFELKRVDLYNKVLTYRQSLFLKNPKEVDCHQAYVTEVETKIHSFLIECDWSYYVSELQDDIIRIKVWTDDGVEEYKG